MADADKLEQAEAEARDWKNAAESENVMRKQAEADADTQFKLRAQAEAEVALRDRMLRDIIERIALTPERWNGWTTEEVLADLRARAEESDPCTGCIHEPYQFEDEPLCYACDMGDNYTPRPTEGGDREG